MKKTKTQINHSKNSDIIIQATKALLIEKGYHEVSVRDICERCGVSRSSFYSVFSGKDDVIVQMFKSLKENTAVVLDQFILAGNDLERMWRLYDIYLSIPLEFGPDLTGSLLLVDSFDSVGFVDQFYSYTEWYYSLAKSCQEKGIIRNPRSHIDLVNAAQASAFGVVFEWCRKKGAFDLRETSFTHHETIYDVHPNYRGIWKKLANESV